MTVVVDVKMNDVVLSINLQLDFEELIEYYN